MRFFLIITWCVWDMGTAYNRENSQILEEIWTFNTLFFFFLYKIKKKLKYRTLLEGSKFIIHTFKNPKFQITIHYNFPTLKLFLVEALYCKNPTRLQKMLYG